VALDYAFYAIYGLLVLELLISILAWRKQDNENLVRALLTTGRIIYPLIVIGGGAWMVWYYGVI
jgi:hypothetical protein